MTIFPKSDAPLGLQLISLLHIVFPAGLVVCFILTNLIDAIQNGWSRSEFGFDFQGAALIVEIFILLPLSLPIVFLGYFLSHSNRNHIKKILKILSLIVLSLSFTAAAVYSWAIIVEGGLWSLLIPSMSSMIAWVIFLFTLIHLICIIYLLFSKRATGYLNQQYT